MRPALDPDVICEGLSRAVVAGIVTDWTALASADRLSFHVETADRHRHVYTPEQATAFVDAVFAAERIVR